MSIKETLLQTAAAEIDEAVTALVKAQNIIEALVKRDDLSIYAESQLRLADEQIEEVINRLGV